MALVHTPYCEQEENTLDLRLSFGNSSSTVLMNARASLSAWIIKWPCPVVSSCWKSSYIFSLITRGRSFFGRKLVAATAATAYGRREEVELDAEREVGELERR